MHPFHRVLSVLSLGLASLPTLPAQGHTRAIPKVFTGWYAGVAHGATLGRTKLFIQTWYRGDNLPIPHPILQVGWRVHRGVVAPAQQHTLEIVLTSTTTTYSTISKTFQSNLGMDAAVFFSLKTINLPAQNGPTDPDTPALWIQGDRPFAFLGPHFLMQVDVQTSATPTATPYRTDGYSFGTGQTMHGVSETGCSGSLTASYVPGTWSLQATGAQPNGPVLFLVGRENMTLGGSVQLPLDLTPLGMTGCVLAVDPLLIVPTAANSSGSATLTAPFTLGPEALVVHAQAITGTTNNSVRLGTTNATHSILGDGLSTYVYNFTVFTPVAQHGPFPNVAEIVLIKP